MSNLWVEKYRPKTMNEYVWRDPEQRKIVEAMIASKVLPNLMLCGIQGSGKTSLAELLLRELQIPSGDILKVNASKERRIDEFEAKIMNFVSTWALGPTEMKYIILDEADSMSQLAQRMLRGEIEGYDSTTRWIITCNYPEKIIPALHSRLQTFQFQKLDNDDFIARTGQILLDEEINFEVEDLLVYIDKTYPDLRKCINLLQQNCLNGTLLPFKEEDDVSKDYMHEMVSLFQQKRYLEARKLIVAQAQLEEYPDIFKFLYRNLQYWGDTQEEQDEALLVIRKGLVHHGIIADPEINLSATICELSLITKGKH